MAIMQMVVVACLGMKNTPGENARSLRNESLENVLSRRGLIRGKGKKVIFIVSSSIIRRSGLWNHLIWSYGCRVIR